MYENKTLIAQVEKEAEHLFGLTKSILNMTLTDYYDKLTSHIYSEGFNLDTLVRDVTQNMFQHIENFFKKDYLNYCDRLKKIVTSFVVSLRCLVLDLTNHWLSFYCKEFWTFVESAVNKFEFMKKFILETFNLQIMKYKPFK